MARRVAPRHWRRVLALGAVLLAVLHCTVGLGGRPDASCGPDAFVAAGGRRCQQPAQRRPRIARRESAGDLDAVATAELQEERRKVQKLIASYRADNGEAWASLALTAGLWLAAVVALHVSGGHWASIIFLALNMVRCFIVFHDASHLSFFEDAASNRRLAQILQYFVNYSYEEWDSIHNSHHAHFGDSTVRDASLTVFFSEQELAEASLPLRWAHRLIRDPLLFFPLAGFFVFYVNKPLIHGPSRALLPLLLWLFLGPQTALAYVASGWLAGSLGVAAFHLQHHCNGPYRMEDAAARSSLDAAMLGSTRIPLAFPLSVFSFGIEYHHIHHFDVRVPGYRLPRCDAEGERLGLWKRVNSISPIRALKSLFHTQFEGSRKFTDRDGTPPRFVSFWPYSALGLQDA